MRIKFTTILVFIELALSGSYAMAATYAYVTNGNDNTVSVINTATNAQVGQPIPVGNGPIFWLLAG